MNQSTEQMQLATSPTFLTRLEFLMARVAVNVLAEAASTPGHAQRANYARQAITLPGPTAQQAAVLVCGGINLLGTVVVNGNTVDSSATDEAIFAQVTTMWDPLSGVETPGAGAIAA